MRKRIFQTIDVSSCNAATAATTAVTVMGPMNIQEHCCFEAMFVNDAAYGSAATAAIVASLQMAPHKDGPWYTRANGTVNSGSCSVFHDINNQVGWLRVNACSTSTINKGGLRMILSHVAKRG